MQLRWLDVFVIIQRPTRNDKLEFANHTEGNWRLILELIFWPKDSFHFLNIQEMSFINRNLIECI